MKNVNYFQARILLILLINMLDNVLEGTLNNPCFLADDTNLKI